MIVIGLSAYYHESACALLADGRLVAAVEEERLTRVKHDSSLPVSAFRACLDRAGVDITDVSAVGYYEEPRAKLARQLWSREVAGGPAGRGYLDGQRPERDIRQRLGWDGPIFRFPHHLSHAASAYLYSGFDESAVLTVDGVGEWTTGTSGTGRGVELNIEADEVFPDSLGLFYATVTAYLGFAVNDGEYKVMGLAPYGQPRFREALGRALHIRPNGTAALDMTFFEFVGGRRMWSPAFEALLGTAPRPPESAVLPAHCDIARSAQSVLEEALLVRTRALADRTGLRRLSFAGGVAQNCVAIGRIRRETPFGEVFVPPGAGDSGGAMGAAALAYRTLTGRRPATLVDARLGPSFDSDGIGRLLASAGIAALDFRGREGDLVDDVAGRLASGAIVGWFQGPMEFGARALGARSILADPRDEGMREKLNARVKKREAFRPFAPSVLASAAGEVLDLDHASPFMLETCAVRSPLPLPAVTHVDGSARPHTVDPAVNPRFAALLRAFRTQTGVPLLVNTSMNVRGEPIVCTPTDAITDLVEANLDALVLEDFVVPREAVSEGAAALLSRRSALYGARSEPRLRQTIYSFF